MTTKRLASLDGARGLAAAAVVLAHAQSNSGSKPIFRGQPAVDLFFTLSGFVLSYVYLTGKPIVWKDFAIARFARIYPLHIATACTMALLGVIYSAVSHATWPEHINVTQGVREFTLTMTMPVVGALKLWNFPAWSISVEWWVYFTLFPVIAIWGNRASIKAAIALFLVTAIPLALWLHTEIKPTRYEPAFARALVGFAGGWIAWRVYQEFGPKVSNLAGLAIALGFVLITTASPFVIGDDAWFLIPFYPVLVYSLTVDSSVSRFLSRKMPVWLGTVSYSIYLIHPIVLNVLEAVDAKIIVIEGALPWMALTFPITLVIATASYRFFENPLRRYFTNQRCHRLATAL